MGRWWRCFGCMRAQPSVQGSAAKGYIAWLGYTRLRRTGTLTAELPATLSTAQPSSAHTTQPQRAATHRLAGMNHSTESGIDVICGWQRWSNTRTLVCDPICLCGLYVCLYVSHYVSPTSLSILPHSQQPHNSAPHCSSTARILPSHVTRSFHTARHTNRHVSCSSPSHPQLHPPATSSQQQHHPQPLFSSAASRASQRFRSCAFVELVTAICHSTCSRSTAADTHSLSSRCPRPPGSSSTYAHLTAACLPSAPLPSLLPVRSTSLSTSTPSASFPRPFCLPSRP